MLPASSTELNLNFDNLEEFLNFIKNSTKYLDLKLTFLYFLDFSFTNPLLHLQRKSQENPKLSIQVKLLDPSGKTIQDRFVASHGKLVIEFPETGMVGDYQLIWQYHSGSKVIMQSRQIIPIVGEEQQSSEGCGAGTVMVNGVCQFAKTSGTSKAIEPLEIVIAAVAIGGGASGAVLVWNCGSGTP